MGNAAQPIRVSLLDDHALVRLGLARAIEQQPDLVLAGSYASGAEALQALAPTQTDILVLDYALAPGDISGPELILALKQQQPRLRVIILTASIEEAHMSTCLEAGASGVAHKRLPLPELMDVIRMVHGGKRYVDPGLAR